MDQMNEAESTPMGKKEKGPRAAPYGGTSVSFTLRISDLYLMWQTSPAGYVTTVLFLVLGLALISVVLVPDGHPVAAGVAVGVSCLAIAPFLAPAVLIVATGQLGMIGKTICIRFDEEGLDGWKVPWFRQTTWECLRHPRLESRVLVLPFSWPFADSWVPVPARAFTPAQYEKVMLTLKVRGFFHDGDHRSLMGRVLDGLARWPGRGGSVDPRHLREFPRIPRMAR
jgi:hypothetical protein